MTTHTLTGTVTDPMGASATDTLVVDSTAAAPLRVVRRSLMANRISWGSVIDQSPRGPSFSNLVGDGNADVFGHTSPPTPVTLTTQFEVLASVRLVGCRIYKAPAATGTNIPVKVWSAPDYQVTTVGTEIGSATIPSWVADQGGWRQVTLASPISLAPGTVYTVGFLAADGIFSHTQWVWHVQDTCVWPLINRHLVESTSGNTRGSGIGFSESGGSITADVVYPTRYGAANYYVDPLVEWDDPMPGWAPAFFDQWSGPKSRHAFPVAVFHADPPFVSQYYDAGVNTLVEGSPVGSQGPDYVQAMNAMGNAMDWWPAFLGDAPAEIVTVEAEQPQVAAQIMGYSLDDEPDMSVPYRPPSLHQAWRSGLRQRESTRPLQLGFGRWAIRNQSFAWSPQGATAQQVNELWRQWAATADLITCDDYTLSDGEDPAGVWGVWAYAHHVGRMRDITDSTKPVWVTIETTSQTPGQPVPDDVRKAVWATLISGATGIIFFDHRFASDFVTQDFAAMLSDPPMLAMVTALSARLQSLGPALLTADTGKVTSVTSSNTTAGPLGGTYGVPLHYTTRAGSGHEYLFAMGIRPGATTATFTVPSWAGQTVTVLDESRTVTVSPAGVLTDTFAADYEVHLYQR